MIDLAALRVLAHTLAHVAPMAIAGRRTVLELGLRRYDPARHRLYCRRQGEGPRVPLPMDLYRDYWKHTWASVSRSLFNTLLAPDVAPGDTTTVVERAG